MTDATPDTLTDDGFGFLDAMEAPQALDVPTRDVEDKCGDTAFRYCFLGLGQAGGRMAEAFYRLGYRRVAVINTAPQDLATLSIPEESQLLLKSSDGLAGAGKDMARAAALADRYREDILDHLIRAFGPKHDRIIVCVGAGGGTGGGTVATILDLLTDLPGGSGAPVGVLTSLPNASEGDRVSANACQCLDDLLKRASVGESGSNVVRDVSPLVIVDNERIHKLFPSVAASRFWDVANNAIAGMFHLFNKTAATESTHTAFDPRDYASILDSGVITFGSCSLAEWGDPTAISSAIRDQLRSNVLVENDSIASASVAGCVFIGSATVMDTIPQDALEQGFQTIDRQLGENSMVHRGVYAMGSRDALTVYTLLGGLGAPGTKLAALAKKGNWWPTIPGTKGAAAPISS